MKTVVNLLRKELKSWKKEYASEKYYYKGEPRSNAAIRSFSDCEKHISELEKAIKILNE